MSVKVTASLNVDKIVQQMKIKEVEFALANEMRKNYAKYEPFQTGSMGKNVEIKQDNEKTQIIYNSPYAHYVHTGKLFLASNGSSWARKGETKHETNTLLNYGNGRGANWTETAKQVHGDEWVKFVEGALKR